MNKADFLVREIKIEILNGMMWMLKLQMDPKFKVKTFRFKFDEDFQTKLNGFAKLNRYADRHEFKEAWEKWCEANRGYIDDEEGRLKREGYDGDVINKMYTSARYYFRKKPDKKTDPVQRCKYVSINSDVIEKMDEHVAITVREPNFKPASAFKDFCEVNKNLLTNEVGRLYNKERLPTNEIKYKFKKAYKNRYFQMVKQI
jgi:hypothetical protein